MQQPGSLSSVIQPQHVPLPAPDGAETENLSNASENSQTSNDTLPDSSLNDHTAHQGLSRPSYYEDMLDCPSIPLEVLGSGRRQRAWMKEVEERRFNAQELLSLYNRLSKIAEATKKDARKESKKSDNFLHISPTTAESSQSSQICSLSEKYPDVGRQLRWTDRDVGGMIRTNTAPSVVQTGISNMAKYFGEVQTILDSDSTYGPGRLTADYMEKLYDLKNATTLAELLDKRCETHGGQLDTLQSVIFGDAGLSFEAGFSRRFIREPENILQKSLPSTAGSSYSASVGKAIGDVLSAIKRGAGSILPSFSEH